MFTLALKQSNPGGSDVVDEELSQAKTQYVLYATQPSAYYSSHQNTCDFSVEIFFVDFASFYIDIHRKAST
uniref:Uncharacterized protein n=1 Tax=Ascaris lumbricoides TaxID=6252 RepID=A0A0M3I860_ASCLU